MKLVESFEEFGLLIKGTSDTIESEPSGGFLVYYQVLLDTLGNLLTDKGARISQRRGVIKAGEETIRRGQDF